MRRTAEALAPGNNGAWRASCTRNARDTPVASRSSAWNQNPSRTRTAVRSDDSAHSRVRSPCSSSVRARRICSRSPCGRLADPAHPPGHTQAQVGPLIGRMDDPATAGREIKRHNMPSCVRREASPRPVNSPGAATIFVAGMRPVMRPAITGTRCPDVSAAPRGTARPAGRPTARRLHR
jgi:hypothetical protein